ncbi:MAG TPA: hypothetical protein VK846_15185 [Candidatus Limnocylindria bacterium]|nr:hypothetical protein [Candidatus Limnocylindria bacterium]
MEATLKILNEIETAGLVKWHAIGGAMAAYFYSEAVVTEDLDAFVLLAQPASGLLTLTPVYEFLKARGATERREHLLLAGTLLQVIPAYDSLTEEAVQQAVERQVGQTPTRVMRPEHLIAIALKTGRAKDHARVALLLEEADVDSALLTSILERHQLLDRWNQFKATQP